MNAAPQRAAALALALLGWTLLNGCPVPEVRSRFLPAYEPFDPAAPGWRSTKPVLLVADCQVFNLQSLPVPERNLSSQTLVPTAIRSPQLNLFTPDVLRWILADPELETAGVLHLGDALDVGCEGEFTTFLEVMSGAARPWLMAPGNHDCFYFGNYDPVEDEVWAAACHAAGEPMRKDRFVRLYVAALLRQADGGFEPLARSLRLEGARERELAELAALLPAEHRWEAPEGSTGFLDAIAWKADDEKHWRSFVIQRANLDGPGSDGIRCAALLVDSCQYELRPAMLPNAWSSYPLPLNVGLTGELLGDQLRILREWMEELAQLERLGILMLHHPVSKLAARTRSNLEWLVREVGGAHMYVSAHTHEGHYAYHPIDEERELMELNLGSTTDWPMEWRTLAVHYRRQEGRREAYVHSRRSTLAERLRNSPGFFQAGWEVPFGELDDYRGYREGEPSHASITDIYLAYHLKPPFLGPARVRPRPGAIDTEAQYKRGLLSTYDRLLRFFPTDAAAGAVRWPAGCASDEQVRARIAAAAAEQVPIAERIALLAELEPFERTRRSRDPASGASTDDERLRFKLSQAVWASRYEHTRGRSLRPEDELVRVRLRPASAD